MKRNLVIKVSLLTTIALFIFAVAIGFVIDANNVRIASDNLIDVSNIYADMLKDRTPEEIAKSGDEDTRITIIATDGKVVADTYGNESAMDNHLNREEIQNIIQGKKAQVVKRHSDTGNINMLYYAVSGEHNGETYFVRVAMPSRSINQYLQISAGIMAGLIIIIGAVSIFIARNFAKASLKPLASLKENLNNIKSGNFVSAMPHERYSELNVLISDINDIGETLSATVAEVKSEHNKLKYLLEYMSQAVIAVDRAGVTVMCNTRAKNLFGSKLKGKAISLVLCDNTLEECVVQAKEGRISTEHFERNGKFYRMDVSVTPYDNMDIEKIILVTDVTKVRLAERERREFFSNCSHELKTPLTVIKGYSELIANGMAKGDKVKSYSESIGKDSEKLLGIIDDMLVLSRLDEKIGGGERADIDIKEKLEEIVRDLKEIDGRNIKCTVSGDNAIVNMPLKNLHSLLKNVVENAFKYNVEDGSVDITVVANNGKPIVTVKDSGIGIPRESLPRVTERFYRVDASRNALAGSGLGLAIVKHICNLYRIRLDIESEQGVGTTVTLAF